MKPQPDKEIIADSLARMARAAGRTPSRREFHSNSGISEHAVLKCFPSWNAALQAAGLEPYILNVHREDRELLEDWGHVLRRNRKIPTCRAYFRLGKFDRGTLKRRFGPWSKLPEAFRNFAQDKPEWADVLALLPPPAAQPSRSSLGDGLGARSGAQDSVSAPCSNANKRRYRPLRGRPTYGRPMDFRGLRHEPVNEQGVVLLFGMVAKELGYTVEAVQYGFPDCEAKRQIAPQRWQRVQIEFEFESRNFRDHGHSLTGCDIIVCWRHNWPDCPPHIEILELSSLVQSLPTTGA